MTININNYEAYLVDYSEGNLSEQQAKEVIRFLTDNPDIKEQFEHFNESVIEMPNIFFNEKDNLKDIPYELSSVKSEFFQHQCVAKIERLLSKEEEAIFDKALLSGKDKQFEFNLYAKTKLKAESILFNEKLTLKQNLTSHVINPDNFDEYCIACTEGWLNHEGVIALNEYIAKNKELKKEYDLFSQIKYTPDYSIVFADKNSIKRFQLIGAQSRKYISVAASVAAMLALAFFAYKTPNLLNNVQTVNIVNVENAISKKTTKTVISNSQTLNKVASQVESKPNIKSIAISESVFSKEISQPKRTLHVESIKPKTIDYIECKKCDDNEMIKTPENLAVSNIGKTPIERTETARVMQKTNPRSLASNLILAGVSGISKISSGKVKVKKQKDTEKTKLVFSSRYLAFSANVKSNNKN